MGIASQAKQRSRPMARSVAQWARQHQGYSSSPSQQAFEAHSRDAYFWRR